MEAASDVLKRLLTTKTGVQFHSDYKELVNGSLFSFLHPFRTSKKQKVQQYYIVRFKFSPVITVTLAYMASEILVTSSYFPQQIRRLYVKIRNSTRMVTDSNLQLA